MLRVVKVETVSRQAKRECSIQTGPRPGYTYVVDEHVAIWTILRFVTDLRKQWLAFIVAVAERCVKNSIVFLVLWISPVPSPYMAQIQPVSNLMHSSPAQV